MTHAEIKALAGNRPIPPWIMKLINASVVQEREACLRIQEDWQCVYASDLVQKIRARGEV